MTPKAAPNPRTKTESETRALRWLADTLALWGLCAHTRCRRAQQCRGAPRDCLARYIPLVPEEAREGAEAMIAGLGTELPFRALWAEAPGEIGALDIWVRQVQAAAHPLPRNRQG